MSNHTTRIGAFLAVAVLATLAIPTAQGDSCDQEEKNTQCNAFGSIAMDTQREIRGETIEMTVDLTVHDSHMRQGARYIMFSARHDAGGYESPVSLSLKKLESSHGAIFTNRVDHDVPNEINAWAHVADVPEDTPIKMVLEVGASQRGAYRIETLVMPFDRGYEALRDRSGEEVTMFSFTMLGVNEASGHVGMGDKSLVDRVRVPGFTAAALLAVAGAVAIAARGRRR